MASEDMDIVWRRNNHGDSNHAEVWDDTALIQAYDKAINRVKEEIAIKNGYSSVSNQGNNKAKKNGKKMKWKVGHFCRSVYSEDGRMYEACITSINESDKTCQVQYVGYENEEIVCLDDLSPSLGRNARIKQEQEARIILNGEASAVESSPNSRSTSSLSHRRVSKQRSNIHHGQHCRNVEQDANTSSYQPHHVHSLPKFPMPGPHLVPPIPPHPFLPPFTKSLQSPTPFIGQNYNVASKLPSIPPPPVFPYESTAVSDEESLASMLMAWYMTGYHTGFYQGLKQSQFKQNNCSKHNNCCGYPHH